MKYIFGSFRNFLPKWPSLMLKISMLVMIVPNKKAMLITGKRWSLRLRYMKLKWMNLSPKIQIPKSNKLFALWLRLGARPVRGFCAKHVARPRMPDLVLLHRKWFWVLVKASMDRVLRSLYRHCLVSGWLWGAI